MHSSKPTIVVAGASGFIGSNIRSELSKHYDFRALTRSRTRAGSTEQQDATEWRLCDLYSLPQVESAMEGADIAIYLVHSMMPSSRLVQANFADLDLILADNFVRAAEANGIKHIIYLGGLMPDAEIVSQHLESRREVERVLRSRSIPVTVLRAGLVFGPGGSSTQMLINLVRNLPVMVMPRWTQSMTQTIDVQDVVRAFKMVLEDESLQGQTYDLGCHDAISYGKLIETTAQVIGKKPIMLRFPLNVFALSRRWVALFGKVSMELVSPLLESLEYDLKAEPNPLLDNLQADSVPLEESIRKSMNVEKKPIPNPRSKSSIIDSQMIRMDRRVRSVQRMPMPKDWTAPELQRDYGNWITRLFYGLIAVKEDEDETLCFMLTPIRLCLLELTLTPYSRKAVRRRAYYITGGVLARKQLRPHGRFEFRTFPENGCLITAIHGFAPSLPWVIYYLTQAQVHLVVMNLYSGRLKRLVKA